MASPSPPCTHHEASHQGNAHKQPNQPPTFRELTKCDENLEEGAEGVTVPRSASPSAVLATGGTASEPPCGPGSPRHQRKPTPTALRCWLPSHQHCCSPSSPVPQAHLAGLLVFNQVPLWLTCPPKKWWLEGFSGASFTIKRTPDT